MEGDEEGAHRRPADVVVRPVLARVLGVRGGLGRLVPPELRLVVVAHHKLVPRRRVHQPVPHVLLGHKRGRNELALLVGHGHELGVILVRVHLERVRLVQLVAVRFRDGRNRLRLGRELDKRKALGGACVVLGHIEPVLHDGPDLREELADDVRELFVLLLGHDRQAVHDDHLPHRRVHLWLLVLKGAAVSVVIVVPAEPAVSLLYHLPLHRLHAAKPASFGGHVSVPSRDCLSALLSGRRRG